MVSGRITRKFNTHKHRPDSGCIDAMRAITAVNRRAVDTHETTGAVSSNGFQGVREASQEALPCLSAFKQSIRGA